ncbi:MAG: stage II sporulation protein M, partial [Chryseobacterium sp.]|nr:stage II sporulation protein M [Chryseobacterium sp.]
MLYAFVFFTLFTAIGFISTFYDKDFPRSLLGDEYVNMTIENIKKGNAVGVYASGSNWGTAFSIIFNNLMVGAKLYIWGIFGGIGSLYALLQNSIMLGAFQYFFKAQGALADSARGIWLHGVFEIFSMVIETMAGLILGASILFPKTLSRFNSFKIGFKDSFKIFLSTVPFTIVAGLIEGFVTRYALKMPVFLNLLIIFGTLSIIVFYYFMYSRIRYKKLIYDSILPEEGFRSTRK